jgi:hypothetical protein
MSGTMHVILIICAILFGVFWVANAAIMLVSPRLWFRLPYWSGVHGTMTERKYGDTWGRLQIRTLGGMFLAIPLWIIYDIISN